MKNKYRITRRYIYAILDPRYFDSFKRNKVIGDPISIVSQTYDFRIGYIYETKNEKKQNLAVPISFLQTNGWIKFMIQNNLNPTILFLDSIVGTEYDAFLHQLSWSQIVKDSKFTYTDNSMSNPNVYKDNNPAKNIINHIKQSIYCKNKVNENLFLRCIKDCYFYRNIPLENEYGQCINTKSFSSRLISSFMNNVQGHTEPNMPFHYYKNYLGLNDFNMIFHNLIQKTVSYK